MTGPILGEQFAGKTVLVGAKPQAQPATVIEASAHWIKIIRELEQKRKTAQEQLAQIREEKRKHALEASLGGEGAKKILGKLDAEASRIGQDIENWGFALDHAARNATEAGGREAEAAEVRRMERQGARARKALKHAEAFTNALREAVRAAESLHAVIGEMETDARGDEQAALNRTLGRVEATRAAEAVGLRKYVDFAPYFGPPAHLMPLEGALRPTLERWLTPEGGK
jgi:seryl-tRNA synthetase